jgi:hypothetical protein
MTPDLKATTNAFCLDLTQRAARGEKDPHHWFQMVAGPWYLKVLLHQAAVGVRTEYPAAFCFVVRADAPFGWSNYRTGDILPPKTSRQPWKMDTGAVGNVLSPDGAMSYWVLR